METESRDERVRLLRVRRSWDRGAGSRVKPGREDDPGAVDGRTLMDGLDATAGTGGRRGPAREEQVCDLGSDARRGWRRGRMLVLAEFFLAALFLPGGSLAPASAARMRVCDGSDQAPPATPHAVDRRRTVPATEVLRRLR